MTELTKKTKSELLDEIARLKAQLARYEQRDMDIRSVREKVTYLPDVNLATDPGILGKMLGNINELVYFIEITPDNKRHVRYIGPQVEQILGVTIQEYVDELDKVVTRCHPDDIPGIVETAQRLKGDRSAKAFIYRFFHSGKQEYIWIEETVYPQYDETGRHSANIGVSRDITDRKRTEGRLKENEQDLSLILNNIGEVVYYVEYDKGKKNVKYISERVEELMGLTCEEYRTMQGTMIQQCHPDDVQHVLDAVNMIRREKKPATFRYRFKHLKTGEYRWIEEQLFPRYDENGKHFANFGVTRDITSEQQALAALSESEKALSLVLNNIGDVIYHVDFLPDGKKEVRFVSENIENVLGLPKAEYLRLENDLVRYCHPDDLVMVRDTMQEVVRTPLPKTLFYRFRHAASNEYLWIEERVFPSTSPDGKIVSLFGIVRNVDALQKALEALQQSENRLLQISESSPVGIFITDETGRPVYINKKVEDISGLPADKILQHAWFRRMHPADGRRLIEKIRHAVRERSEYSDEFRFRRSENEPERWLRIKVSVIGSPKSKFSGWVGMVEDITATMESDRLLRESEEKFRMLAENASDIVYRYTLYPEPHYEYVSPSAEAITGYSPEDFYNDPYLGFKIVHPADTALLDRSEEALRTGVRLRTLPNEGIVTRWVKKNGEIIWTETRNKPVFDSKGTMIAIEGISRDITRQKNDEDALRESEERFRLLSQAAMEGIIFIRQGRIVDANEQFLNIFGYSTREEITGLTIDRIITPQQIGALQDQKYATDVSTYEIKCRRKDGKEIFVEARGQDIPLGGDMVRILTINDITERKLAENALRESERTLATLMANMPGMAYRGLYDEHWTMLFVSQGCQELTGYLPADLTHNRNITFASIVHPDDRRVGREEIETAIRTRSAFEIQYRIISSEGKERWVWEKGQGVYSPKGELLFIEGFITDVTERKHYEMEVLASRENYKNLIEKSPDGIIVMTPAGEAIYANPTILRMMGADAIEEMSSRQVFDFVLPEYLPRVKERQLQVLAGQEVPFESIRARRANGEILEIETKPVLYDYQGDPTLLIIIRDITVQRQLEKEHLRAQIAEETNRRLQAEIEERIRAERLLEANQKYVRMLIDSSLDMICASDKEGIITEFNQAAQRTFGYKAEEVIGKHVSFLYKDPKQRVDVMQELIEGRGQYSGEVVNKKKNGDIFTAYLSASVLRNDKGELIGAMGVSRDITELKKAERELRESEERYRAIYDQAYVGIARVGLDGQFLQVNDQLCLMMGYTQDEMLAKTFMDITQEDHAEQSQEFQRALIAGEIEKFRTEKRYIHKNGSLIYANLTSSIVRDSAGNPEYFVSVFQDITEKKKADEQIRMQAAKMNAVFETSTHHIWTVDREFRLTSCNRNQAEWIRKNYGVEPHVGLSMVTGEMISTEEMNNFWHQKLESTFKGQRQHFETFFTDKSGETTWREVYLNPIYDETGQAVEVSCIAHDVTDKKQSEEKLKLSLKEKEVLLKEVHHRVKNNLQVISSILNLQSSYVRDRKTLELLRESQNRIKSMAFIHESLYQTKDFSNINFSEYVHNISKNLVHSYSGPDNVPELHLETGSIFLNLDTAIPCGLVINELLSNALKYAFPNGRKGNITVQLEQNDGAIRITIADDGVGLPEDVDYRNTESLGLQLVVTLVEQINGKIRLENKKGTKFVIDFKYHTSNP